MKIIPETIQDITSIITAEFRTFGGGQGSSWNPIAAALQDSSPQFAAGVSVEDVVERVVELYRTYNPKTKEDKKQSFRKALLKNKTIG